MPDRLVSRLTPDLDQLENVGFYDSGEWFDIVPTTSIGSGAMVVRGERLAVVEGIVPRHYRG